ncbi:(Lyso)-N-acylphosphatidylethanolamine lipase isoform X2 [Panthera uncia]|nr:(Lyso)-N-acylphosphatidylethanolamine lipase isoform X2 [Panthera uncia]XP_049467584.1 (Lyso)-N-acylphosphatidylethanolamine lipase isoform X2 [Panthera uncia]
MSHLKNVEARILQCLQNKFLARYVSLPNQNKIWTVTVSPELRERTPLVMVHGFGGGVGLWILNMDSLSARRTLHTFDLLGFGRSSRPTFPRDPEGAEDEFVTSIETWRETMGIPSMILLGHSLGGFLATSYSIKYPERVKHLILVDPWGFPLRPTDPSEIRAPPTWFKAVASVLGRSNPLAVLRVAGPWGPGLVQRFRPDFKRKFADFFEDDTISEYIYHCNAQNPSGETAFKAMMESFGWARRPMLERIHLIRKDVPITMIYGANTWIDTSTGKKVKMQRPDSYVRDMVGMGHVSQAPQRMDEECGQAKPQVTGGESGELGASPLPIKKPCLRCAGVAESVEHPTLDFSSSRDPRGHGIEPYIILCTERGSRSPSLPLPFLFLSLSLSLSLSFSFSQIKNKIAQGCLDGSVG